MSAIYNLTVKTIPQQTLKTTNMKGKYHSRT